MGRRTGQEPVAEHTLVERVCHALDFTLPELAASSGIPYDELAPLVIRHFEVAELDRSDTWWTISEYVDRRLAMCLALKAELTKITERDRSKRALRLAQSLQRSKRSSPR